jgi:hypothetical protein
MIAYKARWNERSERARDDRTRAREREKINVDLDAAWWVPPLASPAQHLPGDHNYMCIGSAHCTRAARQRRPLTNENKNGRKIFSAWRNLLNELRKKATSCVGAKWKMLSLWSAREICLCALQPASLLPSEQTSGGAQFIGNFLWRSPFFTANYASWSDTYNGQRGAPDRRPLVNCICSLLRHWPPGTNYSLISDYTSSSAALFVCLWVRWPEKQTEHTGLECVIQTRTPRLFSFDRQ